MGKWEMVRLGDVATYVNGYAFKPSDWEDSGLQIIRIQDLTGNSYTTNYYNGQYKEKYKVKDGDVLISWSASLGVYEWNNGDALLNQHIFKVVFDKIKVDKRYFMFAVNFLLAEMGKETHGSTMKHITKPRFDNTQFPLPPLDEQKCIAKNLDLASEIAKGYKEQLLELDRLVQSVFYEMFKGIKQTVKLSHYVKTLTAGKSLAGTEPCANKVLKTGAVSYDYFDKNAVKYLPLEYKPAKNNLVKEGNVIISRMNTIELVGATAYVWDVNDNTYLPDRLWQAELFGSIANPIFIWQILIQESTKRQIRKVASGTSGSMKNISKPNLLSTTVIDAPLCLQTRFASIVTEIEAQKAQVHQALTEVKNLFNSLMQEYFE